MFYRSDGRARPLTTSRYSISSTGPEHQALTVAFFKPSYLRITTIKTSICEVNPGVKAWSGYVSLPASVQNQVEHSHASFDVNLFFWYFGRETLLFPVVRRKSINSLNRVTPRCGERANSYLPRWWPGIHVPGFHVWVSMQHKQRF